MHGSVAVARRHNRTCFKFSRQLRLLGTALEAAPCRQSAHINRVLARCQAYLVVRLADLAPPHDDIHCVAPAKRVPRVITLRWPPHARAARCHPRVRAAAPRRKLDVQPLRKLDRSKAGGALLPLVAHEALVRVLQEAAEVVGEREERLQRCVGRHRHLFCVPGELLALQAGARCDHMFGVKRGAADPRQVSKLLLCALRCMCWQRHIQGEKPENI